MSLKVFHVVFISFSALLAFAFGFWILIVESNEIGLAEVIAAFFSFAVGIILILYEVKFLQKFKHVKFM